MNKYFKTFVNINTVYLKITCVNTTNPISEYLWQFNIDVQNMFLNYKDMLIECIGHFKMHGMKILEDEIKNK